MALVESRWRDEQMRRSFWDDDGWMLRGWDDWPIDWPKPRELVTRFRSYFDRHRGFLDWPSDWPRMDAVVPRFSSHLDRMDKDWRSDPFWRDLYPRWAEPIFKEGIDIKTKIVNDSQRFAVDVDAYQFRPEEIQVKTVDDTLLIEGRHEDVRDRDNFTKMYFVRKYQLPSDVDPVDVCSSIDSSGRLTVEAVKRQRAISGRERLVPIEGPSRRGGGGGETRTQQRSSSNSPRERDRSESETYHTEAQERRSPQTHMSRTYYHESSRSGGPQPQQQQQQRTHYSQRPEDRGSYESHEKHEREYRSETNREYRSESRDARRDEYHHQDSSLDRNRYRVDSPVSANTYRQQNGAGGVSGSGGGAYDGGKSESRSSVRSVQILRKTFQ